MTGPMNTFKSTLLLVLLTLLLIFVGDRIGGENGMILAFVISVVMNFVSYFYSDKIALAMYRAQPVTREQLPRAYEVVERLAAKDGIPVPKIYVIPTGVAECLCHRPQSAARVGCGNARHSGPAGRRGTGRRAGA